MQGRLAAESTKIAHLHPREIVRLVADRELVVGIRSEYEPHIVVVVRWLVAMSGDRVDVYVEDLVIRRVDRGESGFLPSLPERGATEIEVTVGMTAELDPDIELAMVGQEDPAAERIEHNRGRGEVGTLVRPMECRFAVCRELEHAVNDGRLAREATAIRGECPGQVPYLAGHTSGHARPPHERPVRSLCIMMSGLPGPFAWGTIPHTR